MYDQEMHVRQLLAPIQRLLLNWYFQGSVAVAGVILAGLRMMFPDADAEPNYRIGALMLFTASLLVVDMALAYLGRVRAAKIVGYLAVGCGVLGAILGLFWVLR
jgi:hypothetical protein